jgi:LysM repeat protein
VVRRGGHRDVTAKGRAAGRAAGALVAVSALVLTACGVAVSQGSTLPPVKSAAAVASTTTSTAAPLISYTVARGDTITAIAHRFGVPVAAIAFVNRLPGLDTLAVGQVLRIPPPPPVAFTVDPAHGPAGTSFQLHVAGLQPSDQVTFVITAPGQSPYTGPPHSPGPDGSVTATYQSWPNDATGPYAVVAHTASGRSLAADFRVDPAPPVGTP